MGTSRSDGNTRYLTEALLSRLPDTELIDTGAQIITPYKYDQNYPENDSFTDIAHAIDAARTIIFATPVYWYAMSAQLKLVFDRLTDLTEMHRSIGKRLTGKSAFTLICSGANVSDETGDNLPEGFLIPFKGTAEYFSMKWGGALSITARKGVPFTAHEEEQLHAFAAAISPMHA